MPGPLEGLKVLGIANWVAGPAAGAIMADMGAEVVKIEHPETQSVAWRCPQSEWSSTQAASTRCSSC